MSKPPAIHRQLDRCDVCGKKIHKKDLVRTNFRYNRPAGSNYFTYSRYDSTLWDLTNLTASGNYDGLGPEGLNNRVRVGDGAAYGSYETTTEIGGAPTFTLTSPGKLATSSGVDCSDWTRLCFGLYVGAYHCNTDKLSMTVAIGVGASAGTTTTTLRTDTIKQDKHIWASVDIDDLDSAIDSSDVYFWATITLDDTPDDDFYVWVDWMQLEKDLSRPGAYLSTSGSAVDYTTEQELLTVVKVCPDHRERLQWKSEQWGRPRREVELPIDVDVQEV